MYRLHPCRANKKLFETQQSDIGARHLPYCWNIFPQKGERQNTWEIKWFEWLGLHRYL